MRLNIAACALAMGMLVASVFAQDPSTKPDNSSHPASTAQAATPHRIHVNEDVQKAKLIQTVPAIYPFRSLKRVDGPVVLHVVVGRDGAVKSAKYISGPETCGPSAAKAVLQWRYKPTLVNGVAVEVDTTVPMEFAPLSKQETQETTK
jgi:outer membrane biosynthesis protein TonB